MYSIRNLFIVIAIGAAGCQQAYVAVPEAMNPTPIVEDEAMKLRQWPVASAAYPNGDTVAGTTLFEAEPRHGQEEWRYLYVDSAVFGGNFFWMPYNFFTDPVNKEVVYPGVIVPPSFTAIPAMPAEATYVVPAAVPEEEPMPPTTPEDPAVPVPADPTMPSDPATPADPVAPAEPSTQPG